MTTASPTADIDVSGPIGAYVARVSDEPLLSAAEEIELARRIADGDTAARDRMTRANLRLVICIARGYAGKGIEFADLVQEGNVGLIRAVAKFDPDKGVRFSTYATY